MSNTSDYVSNNPNNPNLAPFAPARPTRWSFDFDPATGEVVVTATLPTTDPGVAGALWNNGGVMNISAG